MEAKAPVQESTPYFWNDLPEFARKAEGFGEFEDYVQMAHAGQYSTAIQPYDNGLVEAEIGAYVVVYDKEGHVYTLWAEDAEYLKFGPFKVTQSAIDKFNLPQDMLGKTLEGDRLKYVDGKVRVVDVSEKPTNEKWLMDIIVRDQHILRELYVRNGLLPMVEPTLFGNDSVIYRLVPMTRPVLHGEPVHVVGGFGQHAGHTAMQRVPVLNDRGEQLYKVHRFLAPGLGWDLIRNAEHLFSGLTGKFLHAMFTLKRGVTLEEGQALVVQNFRNLGPLIVGGLDPYEIHLQEKLEKPARQPLPADAPLSHRVMDAFRRAAEGMGNVALNAMPPKLRGTFNKAAAGIDRMFGTRWHARAVFSGIHAFKHLTWKEVALTVRDIAIGNLALAGVLQGASFFLPVPPFSPLYLTIRTATGSMHKTAHDFLHGMDRTRRISTERYEELMRKVCIDWTPTQTRGLLDEKWIPHLCVRDLKSLRTNIGIGQNGKKVTEAFRAKYDYIGASIQDAPGSVVLPVELNDHKGMHVVAAGSHNVTYLPSVKMIFARLDHQRIAHEGGEYRLPRAVQKVYARAPDNRPFLMIKNDWDARDDSNEPKPVHRSRFIGHNAYTQALEKISTVPYAAPKMLPHTMPDLGEPLPSSPLKRWSKFARYIAGESGAAAADTSLERSGELSERGLEKSIERLTEGLFRGPHLH